MIARVMVGIGALGHLQLAEQDRRPPLAGGRTTVASSSGTKSRWIMVPAAVRNAFHPEQVLDRKRHAVQRSAIAPGGDLRVCGLGFAERVLRRDMRIARQVTVQRGLSFRAAGTRHLDRRHSRADAADRRACTKFEISAVRITLTSVTRSARREPWPRSARPPVRLPAVRSSWRKCAPWHGDRLLVRPAAAEFPLRADEEPRRARHR